MHTLLTVYRLYSISRMHTLSERGPYLVTTELWSIVVVVLWGAWLHWWCWAASANKYIVQEQYHTVYVRTWQATPTPAVCHTHRAPSFSPSSPDVGNSKDPSHVLHEGDSRRAEVGGERDVEPSIAIHQSGVAAVQCNALHHNKPWWRHFTQVPTTQIKQYVHYNVWRYVQYNTADAMRLNTLLRSNRPTTYIQSP